MFPLILLLTGLIGIVVPSIPIPIKDCKYKGEHPKQIEFPLWHAQTQIKQT